MTNEIPPQNPPQKQGLMTPIITIVIFIALVVLFSGSAVNILNSIVASQGFFINIAISMIVLGAVVWFVWKGNFNLLHKEPMEFREIFPEVRKYFQEVYEVNFVPKPFDWEGARLDPTISTYVIVMHFDFLSAEIVSSEHALFGSDIVLRWDAIRNKPVRHTTPLNMDINKDVNGFPLEQGKLTQEGFEKARIKQITTE